MAKNGDKKARVAAAIERRNAAQEALRTAIRALSDQRTRIVKDRDQARSYAKDARDGKAKIEGLKADIKRERGKVREARQGVARARKG